MNQLIPIFFLLIGLAIGVTAAWLVLRAKEQQAFERGNAEGRRIALTERIQGSDQTSATANAKIQQLEAQIREFQTAESNLKAKLSQYATIIQQERKQAQEKLVDINQAQQKLADAFKALVADALKCNNQSFLELAKATLETFQEAAKGDLDKRQQAINDLVKPVKESLDKVNTKINELEKARAGANTGLTDQFKSLAETQKQLQSETDTLAKTVASLETSVGVVVQKLDYLKTTGVDDEIDELPPVEVTPRPSQTPEMSAGEGRQLIVADELRSDCADIVVEEKCILVPNDNRNDFDEIRNEPTATSGQTEEELATPLLTPPAAESLTTLLTPASHLTEQTHAALRETVEEHPGTLQMPDGKKIDQIGQDSGLAARRKLETVHNHFTKLGGKVIVTNKSPETPVIHMYLGKSQACDIDLAWLEGVIGLQTLGLAFTLVTDTGLKHLKGLPTLHSLDLGKTQVTNEGLAILGAIDSLRTLGLSDTSVTDAGLEHLKSLVNLQALYLWRTKVTNTGLKHLQGLTNLHTLDLSATQVTNAGLEHLRHMTGLHTLDLTGTMVSKKAVKHLRRTLPTCTIEHRNATSQSHTSVQSASYRRSHGFLPARKNATITRPAPQADSFRTNITDRQAVEAQITVWLEACKVKHAALNWTLDTVRLLVHTLRIPLDDVPTWTTDGLTVLARDLHLSFEAVLDSEKVSTALKSSTMTRR